MTAGFWWREKATDVFAAVVLWVTALAVTKTPGNARGFSP
jgi:hypothetical protein